MMMENTKTIKLRFSTTGITCGGCANSVRTILGRLPGVVDVSVDVEGHKATVEAMPGVTADQLAAAVRPAGYGLELLEQ